MGNPHILVIPYPVQGHVIPLITLSRCLAENGFRITFVSTESNHQLVNNGFSDNQIRLLSVSDALQSSDDKNKPGKSSGTILRVMPGKVEELIEDINSSDSDQISCILADQSFGWALEIAEKKRIRRAAFCPAAGAQLVLGFSIPKLIEDGVIDEHGTPTKEQMIKISPTMPAMNTAKFVWACLGNKEAQKNIFGIMVNNNKSVKLTDWLLCNSAYELEPEAFNLAPQILPIGPLSAIRNHEDSTETFWPDDSTCLKWLDQNPPQSVIYVAFGSSTVLHPDQFQELALGLELSNRPFLWVVRSDMSMGIKDTFFKEFQDRVGNRGKIVKWVPQQKVLAHHSVACFVSHCGWNSTMEGVSNGIPFLCWPYFADQFFNQSYICDIWMIGLGLTRDGNGMITRGEFKNKLEQLVNNGEFKTRALDLKKIVMNGVKESGRSYQNFQKFVEWLKE